MTRHSATDEPALAASAALSAPRDAKCAEPIVLKLELLQLPGLLNVQTTVFLPVSVVALLGQTDFFAGRRNALALALQYLDLPQLRDDLFSSQPLLRHLLSSFQAIFSQLAWFRKCRSGQDNDPKSLDLARSREPGRGREANSPGEIPPRGWGGILIRVFWAIPANRLLTTSGGVAFFAVLAVFPGIAAIVSLYGLFADPRSIGNHLSILAGILPAGVLQIVADQITMVSKQGTETLGTAFVAALLMAIASANSGIAALFDALNVVYDEREKRDVLSFYTTTFIFTLGGMSFVVTAIIGVVVMPLIMKVIGLETITERLVSILRWPFLLVTVSISLAFIYRYGPS